jgi:hypothetical protein
MLPKSPYEALTWHPHYRYRGCAPDVDDPRRAAGNPGLSVDAWTAQSGDGGEPQAVRRAREEAAIDVCVSCPVMVQCLAVGRAVGADGQLIEREGILGGMRALDRSREVIAARSRQVPREAPDEYFATEQTQKVLRAVVKYADVRVIARVTGLTLRTTNWQRSRLLDKLGLSKTATRNELIDKAAARGLLAPGWVVRRDDGTVPALSRVREDEPTRPAGPSRTRGVRPKPSKFAAIAGQLELDLFDAEARPGGSVTVFPSPSVPTTPVEAAA